MVLVVEKILKTMYVARESSERLKISTSKFPNPRRVGKKRVRGENMYNARVAHFYKRFFLSFSPFITVVSVSLEQQWRLLEQQHIAWNYGITIKYSFNAPQFWFFIIVPHHQPNNVTIQWKVKGPWDLRLNCINENHVRVREISWNLLEIVSNKVWKKLSISQLDSNMVV